jgi:hypothetical protein
MGSLYLLAKLTTNDQYFSTNGVLVNDSACASAQIVLRAGIYNRVSYQRRIR